MAGGVGDVLGRNLVDPNGATSSECFCVAGGNGGDPEDLNDQAETFNGGSIQGWIYYYIDATQTLGKFLAFPPNVTYTDVPGGVGFFAVN